MILNQLKAHFRTAEPVTREFVALMDATFRHYSDIRTHFLDKLPQHLHQSELISFVNVEVKNRLFDEAFCQRIQDSLKSLRRAIIRLEDLRATHPALPGAVNDLPRLAALAERVEALYQKHWEFYRYQSRLNEEELVGFVLEIDQVGYAWDIYLSGFAAVHGLVEAISGRPCPEGRVPLRVGYQRAEPGHFAVGTLRALMDFLEVGYRFICTVCEIDPAEHPLSLLQVEVAEPVELQLAVPESAATAYRRFLQYLFLQDMLKREALLKVVFEAASRDAGREKPLTPNALAGFQRELTAALKKLPADARFSISERTFPDDRVQVLQEFTAHLDANAIRYDMLLRSGGDGKATRKRGKAAAAPAAETAEAPQQKAPPSPSQPSAAQKRPEGIENLFSTGDKEHISVLTERDRR